MTRLSLLALVGLSGCAFELDSQECMECEAPADTGEAEDSGVADDTADSGETTEPAYDADQDGYSTVLDCNDADASINPAASEVCDSADNDCDGEIDENLLTVSFWVDNDGDGYGAGEAIEMCAIPESGYATVAGDCNDSAADTHPGGEDLTLDGIDQDCDDETEDTEDEIDKDGDGYVVGDDCDDTDPAINKRTDYWLDADADGYGDPAVHSSGCGNTGLSVTNDDDCNDADAAINPAVTEVTDSVDNDCDGSVDEVTEEPAVDADGDGYSVVSDCNDSDSKINPAATETFDAVDNDCDGEIDEEEGWEVIVEVSYPVSGSYALNTALYASGSAPSERSWIDESSTISGQEGWIGYLTSEYGDVSGHCGLIINGDGYGLDDLCWGGSRDTSVAFDIYFDSAWYTENNLEVWIADASNGSCALILQVDTSSACDPVNDTN